MTLTVNLWTWSTSKQYKIRKNVQLEYVANSVMLSHVSCMTSVQPEYVHLRDINPTTVRDQRPHDVKSCLLISFQSEDVAICLAASERHIEVLDFLLAQKLNHDRLLSNKKVRWCY